MQARERRVRRRNFADSASSPRCASGGTLLFCREEREAAPELCGHGAARRGIPLGGTPCRPNFRPGREANRGAATGPCRAPLRALRSVPSAPAARTELPRGGGAGCAQAPRSAPRLRAPLAPHREPGAARAQQGKIRYCFFLREK